MASIDKWLQNSVELDREHRDPDPDGVVTAAIAEVLSRLPAEDAALFADESFVRFYVVPFSGVALGLGPTPPAHAIILCTGYHCMDFMLLEDERAPRIQHMFWVGVVAHEMGHIAQRIRNPQDDGTESSANWWAHERGFDRELKVYTAFDNGDDIPDGLLSAALNR